MTERPYETTVPDDLTADRTSRHGVTGSAPLTSSAPRSSAEGNRGAGVSAEAKSVASDAADSGRHVAQTAASGVKDVASEASTQLRQLFDQLRTELDDQASSQGQRAAGGLRSLADELRQMASSSQQQGLAGDAAQQAADRAGSFADWLENRQPGDMLEELRSLARRKPGAFLLGAAAIGLIGGRMTRGLTGVSNGSSSGQASGGTRPAGPTTTDTAGLGSPGVSPASSPMRAVPYAVGVRDSETHAATTPGGVTSEPIDETFSEGRSGVR